MFIGFDYGTANCSIAVMQDGAPRMLMMENGSTLLPSMLSAPTREAVSEWLYRHHQVPASGDETQALLRRAINFNRDEDIDVLGNSVLFGLASLKQYITDPEEVYFVKSPKSFLGASGLKPQQVAVFEDLVCSMMLHIRQQAQSQLEDSLDQAVIGRPINFQGLGGETAKGIALPLLPWWNAVAINDVPAQTDFYSAANGRLLRDLARDARDAEKVSLLYKVWQQRLSYRLVRSAEESKIALSENALINTTLPFISDELATAITQDGLEAALNQPLTRILEQVQLALENSSEKPDIIYLTGGSARSPLIKKALAAQLPGIPIAGGDDFGSVTAGLARWAQVVFA